MTKKFTTVIIVANMILGLLLYFSSQLVLIEISGDNVTGFSISSIFLTPAQTGQVIIPLAMNLPNYPLYAFTLFLAVNVCFIIILIRSKETK
jgi:hypothetical protein